MTAKSGSRNYRTLGDVVREHAAKDCMGTDDGIAMLELNTHLSAGTINGAANLYLTALSIIRKQDEKLRSLRSPTEDTADAKRYRWLREHGEEGIYVIRPEGWKQGDKNPPLQLIQREEMDTVIDEYLNGTSDMRTETKERT